MSETMARLIERLGEAVERAEATEARADLAEGRIAVVRGTCQALLGERPDLSVLRGTQIGFHVQELTEERDALQAIVRDMAQMEASGSWELKQEVERLQGQVEQLESDLEDCRQMNTESERELIRLQEDEGA